MTFKTFEYGAIEGFTQGWAYDDLGNVTTLTYPRCISGSCYGASTVSRTVSAGYTRGWLTSVPGYASSIGYHPNGMVSQVVHGSDVTYFQGNDPNGMRRPSSYSVVKNADGTPMWQSGTYAYDGRSSYLSCTGAQTSPRERLEVSWSSSTAPSGRWGAGGYGARCCGAEYGHPPRRSSPPGRPAGAQDQVGERSRLVPLPIARASRIASSSACS